MFLMRREERDLQYRAIPLSFYNTQICAQMVKYIYLKNVRNSGNTLVIAILRLFTPYNGSVGAFNTTSRVLHIAISLSFDNTQNCAPMVKYIYLKRSRQQ